MYVSLKRVVRTLAKDPLTRGKQTWWQPGGAPFTHHERIPKKVQSHNNHIKQLQSRHLWI